MKVKNSVLAWRALMALAAMLISLPVIAAGIPKCSSNDFPCFQRKMMPSVGHKITIEGVLRSAKLGPMVAFDNWGVYVYSPDPSAVSFADAFGLVEGQTVKLRGTLRYSIGASSDVAGVLSLPEHFFFDAAAVSVISPRPAVTIKFRKLQLRKPPLAELHFEVALHNESNSARWFLLPTNLAAPAVGAKGGVDAVEVFAPRGRGRVFVARFLGTGGFQAILLPPRARVRLQDFLISYWGTPPSKLRLEVILANEVKIGGIEATSWYAGNLLSSSSAEINENSVNPYRIVGSQHTPDNKELPVTIHQDRRLTLAISVR